MNEAQITEGIANARRGIGQYLEIMRLFAQTNVAQDRYFQTKYNAFYRVRQRSSDWYDEYYRHMEEMKGQEVSFSSILRHFQKRLGKYEPSFSSKLLATLNTSFPVWDVHVLSNIGLQAPAYTSPNKYEKAESAYMAIQGWYQSFLCSVEGRLMIGRFDELVEESPAISNIKKIDFILWQTRT